MKHFKRFLNGCHLMLWHLLAYAVLLGLVVASAEHEYGLEVLALTVFLALVFAIYKLGETHDTNR